jgi:hypothetical protein
MLVLKSVRQPDASVPTDHWFTSLFQSTPVLIALLLQAAGAARSAAPPVGPESPGDELYRLKHRLGAQTLRCRGVWLGA